MDTTTRKRLHAGDVLPGDILAKYQGAWCVVTPTPAVRATGVFTIAAVEPHDHDPDRVRVGFRDGTWCDFGRGEDVTVLRPFFRAEVAR